MNVVTLVPLRLGNEERDRLWRFTRDRWERDFPDWPIIEGHHNDGPFNRSAAINAAAEKAGDWDVAVIIDNDIICDPATVRYAVVQAENTGCLYFGGHERVMLSRPGTEAVLAGYSGDWVQLATTVHPDETMCCAIVPRRLWDRVGGFDPNFVGYGYEDLAFQISCETVTGNPVTRLHAPVFHLFHEPSAENNDQRAEYRANRHRYHRYHQAGGNVAAIDELLKELR